MFRVPALVHVAKIAILKIRIRELVERLHTEVPDSLVDDDIDLLQRMLSFDKVLHDVGPLLRECERCGLLPQEIGDVT